MPIADGPVIVPTPHDETRDPDAECTVKDCGHRYEKHFDWTSDWYDEDEPMRPGCKYCDCGSFNDERSQKQASPGTAATLVTYAFGGQQHVAIVTDTSDITERFGPDAQTTPISIDGPATPLPHSPERPADPDTLTAQEVRSFLDLEVKVERVVGTIAKQDWNGWGWPPGFKSISPSGAEVEWHEGGDHYKTVHLPMERICPEFAAVQTFTEALLKGAPRP